LEVLTFFLLTGRFFFYVEKYGPSLCFGPEVHGCYEGLRSLLTRVQGDFLLVIPMLILKKVGVVFNRLFGGSCLISPHMKCLALDLRT